MFPRKNPSASTKDIWAVRKDKALTFASIVTPLVIACIGGWYSLIMKDSENRVRYVELAITQLRAPPSPETAALREWAVNLLDSQSPIRLPVEARAQLKSNSLPVALSGAAQGVVLASGTATLSAGKATADGVTADGVRLDIKSRSPESDFPRRP